MRYIKKLLGVLSFSVLTINAMAATAVDDSLQARVLGILGGPSRMYNEYVTAGEPDISREEMIGALVNIAKEPCVTEEGWRAANALREWNEDSVAGEIGKEALRTMAQTPDHPFQYKAVVNLSDDPLELPMLFNLFAEILDNAAHPNRLAVAGLVPDRLLDTARRNHVEVPASLQDKAVELLKQL